jgi:L-lactate dehydrogenase complex protein LldF
MSGSAPASPVTFHRRVTTALGDAHLHTALDRSTSKFTAQRLRGLSSLPDADAVRDRARAIRQDVIRNLDRYLAEFEASVARVGGHVHRARDAAEARAIVLDLARQYGVKRLVKSKSMIGEEIHINPAMEAEGIRVVETDLGEYIIQLADEPPSHIIAPAIHKTKEQVGQLLHEKLGVPRTDDPAEMTAIARRTLRHDFLGADMGMSGVNFGVAESGAITIVTNEGNASIGVSTPRVHVALMGMERLVPTRDDLAVMLEVLARSATGQKLSVYTDIITGPRRPGDPDGPDALHVVIVDNGRNAIRGTDVEEILLCIRCGACLNACPVYREIGGHAYGSVYSGPVGAVLTPALRGVAEWHDLAEASSLCGACREVCPVRIDIPRMLLATRARAFSQGYTARWTIPVLRLYRIVATRPALFRAVTSAARVVSRIAAPGGWLERAPWPLSGWTRSRALPALAPQRFSRALARRRAGRK